MANKQDGTGGGGGRLLHGRARDDDGAGAAATGAGERDDKGRPLPEERRGRAPACRVASGGAARPRPQSAQRLRRHDHERPRRVGDQASKPTAPTFVSHDWRRFGSMRGISRTEVIVARDGRQGRPPGHARRRQKNKEEIGIEDEATGLTGDYAQTGCVRPRVVECSCSRAVQGGVAPVHWFSWTALVWRHAICSAPAPGAAASPSSTGAHVSQPIKGTPIAHCRFILFIDWEKRGVE